MTAVTHLLITKYILKLALAGTEENLTFGSKMYNMSKNDIFHAVSRLIEIPPLNHYFQVFISKSAIEGMHRSLAKQDTLFTIVISGILPVNEILTSYLSPTNP